MRTRTLICFYHIIEDLDGEHLRHRWLPYRLAQKIKLFILDLIELNEEEGRI